MELEAFQPLRSPDDGGLLTVADSVALIEVPLEVAAPMSVGLEARELDSDGLLSKAECCDAVAVDSDAAAVVAVVRLDFPCGDDSENISLSLCVCRVDWRNNDCSACRSCAK